MSLRALLAWPVLLGLLVASSGPAAALTPAGETVCMVLESAAWGPGQGLPAHPDQAWNALTGALDLAGAQVVFLVVTAKGLAGGSLPLEGVEPPSGSDAVEERSQICIDFLSVCGPVFVVIRQF